MLKCVLRLRVPIKIYIFNSSHNFIFFLSKVRLFNPTGAHINCISKNMLNSVTTPFINLMETHPVCVSH